MLFTMDSRSFEIGDLVIIKGNSMPSFGLIVRITTQSDQKHFPFETFEEGWPVVHDDGTEYPYHPSMLKLISPAGN